MTDSPDTAGKPIKAALIQFALPLSALVLLAGCKSEPQQNDFLYSDDEGVLFVHWTWGGRQIGGTIDVVEREPIGEIRKTVLVFDGTSDGMNVSMDLICSRTPQGGVKAQIGKITGLVMGDTLTFFNANMLGVGPIQFRRATPMEYEEAIRNLEMRAKTTKTTK